MAYVPVPKDLTRIKTKVMFNLTKRQLICFGSGALIGVPLFFLIKSRTSVSLASLLMILSMLPFFLLAMYEKNGQPLEKILRNFIQARFIRSKIRPYQSNNFYSAVIRQHKLDKEVQAIVQTENHSPKTVSNGAAADRNGHRQGQV
ncbi:MAG: PrgI family protein [Eubacteriales bacterium]|nr:PrgI family protein [Eubacteriales bacterium]